PRRAAPRGPPCPRRIRRARSATERAPSSHRTRSPPATRSTPRATFPRARARPPRPLGSRPTRGASRGRPTPPICARSRSARAATARSRPSCSLADGLSPVLSSPLSFHFLPIVGTKEASMRGIASSLPWIALVAASLGEAPAARAGEPAPPPAAGTASKAPLDVALEHFEAGRFAEAATAAEAVAPDDAAYAKSRYLLGEANLAL